MSNLRWDCTTATSAAHLLARAAEEFSSHGKPEAPTGFAQAQGDADTAFSKLTELLDIIIKGYTYCENNIQETSRSFTDSDNAAADNLQCEIPDRHVEELLSHLEGGDGARRFSIVL